MGLGSLRTVAARHPHAALLVAVGAALATEPAVQAGRDASTTLGYAVAAAGLAGRAGVAILCLGIAWEGQRRLELPRVLACAVALGLGWMALHQLTGVDPDQDLHFYAEDGNALLSGSYPSSEYPTGAVLLFAGETWLGGSPPRVVHALAMVGFQLLAVTAIWSLRTRWSPWLAAFVAVWPLNAFHWEFRYDLAPVALLVVGLALAHRERWALAGVAFGVGAALKWSPALALVVLICWLLARGRSRAALVHAAGFVVAFGALTLPFLVWDGSSVVDAYRFQSDRGVTGESIWYLPLAGLGGVELGDDPSQDAGASDSVNAAVAVVQLLLVAVVVLLAARVRAGPHAVALAALAPAMFLLTNRVFSSQFLVLLVAVWALAAALVVTSAREQLAVGVVAAGASFANAVVHPYTAPTGWQLASAVLFVLAIGLTAWLVKRATEPQIAAGLP